MTMKLDPVSKTLIRMALSEDLGREGDITTRHFLPPRQRCSARIVFKEDGVLCGQAVVSEVFRLVCPRARIRWLAQDGARMRRGKTAARITGPKEMLTAERTALNFLQILSGIATFTALYVRKVRGTRAKVYDTRKTPPGLRMLAKYAVRTGGGINHRMGLFDMALLKDNHLAAWDREETRARIRAFRKKHQGVPVEIEAASHRDVLLALELGADIVMLDNMGPMRLRREIRFIRKSSPRTKIEISGGVRPTNIARLARLGPDRISVGRITHSAPAIDISMKVDP